MQILVADDDPVYRNLLAGLLQSPFEAVLAGDGAEALAILLRPGAPDVAVLDWNMPSLDGYEICQAVRKYQTGALPYLLLMTGNTSRQDLLRVLVAGADDYLLKPFEPLDLKIRLRTAVRIVNLERQLRSTTSDTGKEHPSGVHA